MNLLGLDIGDKRIGVAYGSSELRIALPVRVIVRGSPELDALQIESLARDYDAERIIAGLPLLVNGSEGEQARRVREFVGRLEERITTPIEFFDERFSTVEALKAQRDAGRDAGRAPS